MDELFTFIGSKTNRYYIWSAVALQKQGGVFIFTDYANEGQ